MLQTAGKSKTLRKPVRIGPEDHGRQMSLDLFAGAIAQDYEVKPAEYLEFGVDEYWVIDPIKQQMTAFLRWRGQWKNKVVKPSQKYSTPILPEFFLDLNRVLAAK
jgi:hypothetical protein